MLEGDRRDEIELLDLLSAEAHVDEIRKAALGNAGDDPVLQQARLDRALRIREPFASSVVARPSCWR